MIRSRSKIQIMTESCPRDFSFMVFVRKVNWKRVWPRVWSNTNSPSLLFFVKSNILMNIFCSISRRWKEESQFDWNQLGKGFTHFELSCRCQSLCRTNRPIYGTVCGLDGKCSWNVVMQCIVLLICFFFYFWYDARSVRNCWNYQTWMWSDSALGRTAPVLVSKLCWNW